MNTQTSLLTAPVMPCRNLRASADFYAAAFEFSVNLYEQQQYAVMTDNRICVHLFVCAEEKVFEHCGFYLYTDDARSWYERLLPLGCIHPNGHLEAKPWGVLECTATDPDGNLIRIGQVL